MCLPDHEVNMSVPTVTVVKDGDGNVHYYGSGSKRLREGLADGSLTLHEEAKPNEATVPANSGDLDAGTADRGPGDGEPSTRDADGGDDTSTDQPVARRQRR